MTLRPSRHIHSDETVLAVMRAGSYDEAVEIGASLGACKRMVSKWWYREDRRSLVLAHRFLPHRPSNAAVAEIRRLRQEIEA